MVPDRFLRFEAKLMESFSLKKLQICTFGDFSVRNKLFEFLEYLPGHFPHTVRSSPPAVKVIGLI